MKHDKGLTFLAQNLRKNLTREERKLWYEFLCQYPLRFRRQVAFGRCIMDFYCAQAKLAVELDGSQHMTPEGLAKDAERTAFLEETGIFVLRFSNVDVAKNFSGVCEEIDRVVKERADLSCPCGAPSHPQGVRRIRRAAKPLTATLPQGEGFFVRADGIRPYTTVGNIKRE